ncbi:caspase family protein [Sinorhizobium terangae]|uniref:caspase family protein n=1 Tax=Sinorhizobium terangae TaxID=110322 RepID=UPI0024B15A38|nr:caspase family protein [Sinorhizobium terangae]WFU50713.1 caspase family protein [Sinorhizobium terangae]
MKNYVPGRALIVGIASYKNIRSLPAAIRNDINDLHSALINPEVCGLDPTKVTLLADAEANRKTLFEALDNHASLMSSDEPFTFYFSGHGERDDLDQSFLLTHEADLGRLTETAISDTELLTALQSVRSDRQVLILDACHAGAVGTLKSGSASQRPRGLSKKTLDLMSAGKGRVIMSSCRADESSVIRQGDRNSVFTSSLLRGLSGGARPKEDGTVGIFDLFGFVADDVPKFAPQHPVLKADGLEGDFGLFKAPPASTNQSPSSTASPPTVLEISDLLANLFPTGPTQDDIWLRAGGDLSRLSLRGHGRSQWFSAITTVTQGGGGLQLRALLNAVARDFPNHDELKRMIAGL